MKRKNSYENQLAELHKQIQFLQDELEGKTMELSSKTELIKVFSEREKSAIEKKDLFNKEALQYKQENHEIMLVMEGMKREKKELVSIFEAKKKSYEEQIAEFIKQVTDQSKRLNKVSGRSDLEEDIRQLHNTIKSKEDVVQILNEDINLNKSNILRLEKQLKEYKEDNIELHQQNLLFKEECDSKIQKLREEHLKECTNYQTEIDKLIDRIREISFANKKLEQSFDQALLVQKESIIEKNEKESNSEEKEQIELLKRQIEDLTLEKEIQSNKFHNELKCLKESQKDLLSQKDLYEKKYEELEKQVKHLQDKCDQQGALIKLRQAQQIQQPVTNTSNNNLYNSNNLDNASLKREKKILEALSARVQDLTEENANLKQSLQDQAAISNAYEHKLKQKSQILLNIIQEIKSTYPQTTEQKLQEITHMDKEVIQSFKSYSVDDLFSLVEDLFIENMKTKQSIRDILIKQAAAAANK